MRTHPAALAVHTLPGAVDAVLALDNPRMLADAYALGEFSAGDRFEVGPFLVDTWALPHFVPNAGLRLTAGGRVLAYTGDTGPSSTSPRQGWVGTGSAGTLEARPGGVRP